jgi:DNA gyrase inhibitor GyrI
MTIDIVVKREKKHSVISKIHVGPYTGENMLRKEFGDLVKWAKKRKVKTGKWIFLELDGPEVPGSRRRWEACLEVPGSTTKKIKLELEHEGDRSGIAAKVLPAIKVAAVKFDPDVVSSRLIYHGLECWLEWRKKYRELEEAGPTREIYTGNPWTDSKAWANLEVQVPVKSLNEKK